MQHVTVRNKAKTKPSGMTQSCYLHQASMLSQSKKERQQSNPKSHPQSQKGKKDAQKLICVRERHAQ